jgi:hypothetical protein
MKKIRKIINKYWLVFLACIAVILFIFNMVVFYPGYMSNDSMSQLNQALGVKAVGDWHPTIMVFVWRVLINFSHIASSMLMLQMVFLWLMLSILSIFIYRQTKSKKLSLMPYGVGLLPIILNISGVVWKDVHMAFALGLSVILLLIYKHLPNKLWQILDSVLVFSLIIYACLLRYNAFLAIAPVIYLAINETIIVLKSVYHKLLAMIGIFIMIFLFGFLVNLFLSPVSENPLSSVMIDDIINVKTYEELDRAPKNIRSMLMDVQKNCIVRNVIMNGYWLCADDSQRFEIHISGYNELRGYWLKSIISHPFKYISYRVETYAIFLFPPDTSAYGGDYIWQYGIEENSLGQKVRFDKIGRAVQFYSVNFGYKHFSFLFQAWFWLVASAAVLFYSRKINKYKKYVITLSASGLVYILCYIPVVIAADYRYIYWPVLATILATILVITEKYTIETRRLNK